MPTENREEKPRKLKICILHGYLLTGTGSNIFVSNLVRNLCIHGHDVYLFCQEKKTDAIDYVHEYGVFEEGNQKYQTVSKKETPFTGNCFLFNPDLNGILPVYVFDKYQGFTVKTFSSMEHSEIESHIAQNVQAIETVHKEINFDLIQTNHAIISPYIAFKLWEKYKIPYYITLHGSALNFVLKKDERFLPYATSAFRNAAKIFAVSNHNRLEAVSFFKDIASEIDDKFKVIPAGVDTNLFNILDHPKRQSIEALKFQLSEKLQLLPYGKTVRQKADFSSDINQTYTVQEIDKLVENYNKKYEHGHPDQDVIEMLDRIDWEKDVILLFVGKYLWTKGIQMVISSLPFVLKYVPNLHLCLVGFGSYREELEALVHSLESGRRELFSYLIEKSISLMSPGDNPDTAKPFSFLEALSKRKKVQEYFDLAASRDFSDHVHFLGALNHKELSSLLPCADGFVAASVFPEAFGMVSIEALACGVMPIISNQTGFKEIVDLVSETVDTGEEMPRIDINMDMIFTIATNIIENVVMADLRGTKFKRELRQLTLDHFSWDRIAKRYIDFYQSDRSGILA